MLWGWSMFFHYPLYLYQYRLLYSFPLWSCPGVENSIGMGLVCLYWSHVTQPCLHFSIGSSQIWWIPVTNWNNALVTIGAAPLQKNEFLILLQLIMWHSVNLMDRHEKSAFKALIKVLPHYLWVTIAYQPTHSMYYWLVSCERRFP